MLANFKVTPNKIKAVLAGLLKAWKHTELGTYPDHAFRNIVDAVNLVFKKVDVDTLLLPSVEKASSSGD